MGKSVFKQFMIVFGKTIAVFLSMILVFGLAYNGTILFYKKHNERLLSDDKKVKSILENAKVEDISKNLIFVWDEDNKKVSSCILEVFNTKENKLNYITIPETTNVTLSSNFYRKLCTVRKEAPQLMKISEIKSYFDEDKAFAYAALCMKDFLGVELSCYSVIDQKDYDERFESDLTKVKYKRTLSDEELQEELAKQKTDTSTTGTTVATTTQAATTTAASATTEDNSDIWQQDETAVTKASDTKKKVDGSTEKKEKKSSKKLKVSVSFDGNVQTFKSEVNIQKLKIDYLDKVSEKKDETALSRFIGTECEKVKSNLTAEDRMGYADKLLKLTTDDICYYCIPGYLSNKEFVVDQKKTLKFLKSLGAEAKSEEKVEEDSSEKDKDKNVNLADYHVSVLNSTGTAGIAAKYSEKIKTLGYTVDKVGNYTNGNLTTTKIIVKSKEMADEMKSTFTNPEIEVGTPTDGVDIEVIVGTQDVQ